MPRRARREHETSFFHVIVQGIEKKFIFNRKEYIERYIDLLFYEKEKNKKVRILAYCIMNNHAHILLGVENVKSLSEYLRVVNARYAMFYNNKEQRVGYVFRDRYKSEPIYNHDYLYKCLAYIHLNPVEAGMVDEPNMYKYSSYNDYIKKTGIASNENLKILFGSDKDYIKLFNFIHYGSYEFMDYTVDNMNDKEIQDFVNEYMINIKFSAKSLINNELILIDLCTKLNEKGVSNRKIEKLLNISRDKIRGLKKEINRPVPVARKCAKESVPVARFEAKESVPVGTSLLETEERSGSDVIKY